MAFSTFWEVMLLVEFWEVMALVKSCEVMVLVQSYEVMILVKFWEVMALRAVRAFAQRKPIGGGGRRQIRGHARYCASWW